MTGRFRDRLGNMTIRWKLTAIITAISGIALFIGLGAIVLTEWGIHKTVAVKQVSTHAEIIGSNSVASLVFDDREAARETLASLAAAHDIVGAALFGQDGRMFASFLRNGTDRDIFPATPPEEGHYFEGGYLVVSRSIVLDGEPIGSISIISNMQSVYTELESNVVISAVVLSLALFMAFLLSTVLQGVISGPLERLTRLTQRVSGTKDYSLRSEEHGRDETGVLARGFNRMLSEIQKRDVELEAKVKALRESESRYRTLVETIPHGIQISDPEGMIAFSNPAHHKLLGCKEGDLAGKHIWDFVEPESEKAALRQQYETVIEKQPPPAPMFVKNRTLDGRVIDTQVHWDYMRDAHGKVHAICSIISDITERRRAEELLQLLKEAIQTTRLGITITDNEGKIIFTNQAEAEMHGYAIEELIGRESRLFAPPDKWAPFTAEQVNDMGHFSRETLNIRKDGSVFPVSITSVPVRAAGNRPIALISVCKDISEQKRAEQELRRSEERYRTLYQQFNAVLDAIPDVMMLLSPDMKILWLNKSSDDLCRKGETAEQTCHRVCHNRDLPCKECPSRKCFETGNEEGSQFSTPGGRTLDVRAIPIKDAEGRVLNVLEVISDITERIRLQEKALRAKHLASLGELAAGVAHEINNPINSIINYAQILIDESEKGQAGEDMGGRVLKEGNRVAGIVRSLLSFARETEERKVPCSMHEIIEDTLALTETQLRKEGINVVVDVPEGLHSILANARHIQQVLLNLISNSRYALNEKYPGKDRNKELRITGENIGLDGAPHVRLKIHDTGSGIPDDIINMIMNPFFTTKPSGKGTGLGLSICHGIINDHGGRIVFDSVEGKYSEATVELPAAGGN